MINRGDILTLSWKKFLDERSPGRGWVRLQAIKYRNIDGHVARLTHYSHFVDTFRLRKSDINIAGCKAPFKGRMACNRVHVR